MSVRITTPIPSPDEVAESLGLSAERRRFLSDLASDAKAKRSIGARSYSGMIQKVAVGRKPSRKKAA